MLKLSNSIINLPIMSLRTGRKVGLATVPIINPNNLKIEGWYCQDIYSKKQLILPSSEVRDILPQGIAVNDHEAMTDPEDLVRLKDILEVEFVLIGKRVITNHKRRIGKVDDFAVESDDLKVQKIYVNRPLYRSLTDGQISIDRSQVLEVDNKKIVIKDVDIKVESGNISPTPVSA